MESSIYKDVLEIQEDDNLKPIIQRYVKKLIQAVGEEVIGEDEKEVLEYGGKKHTSHDAKSRNYHRKEQRTKLDKILEVIETHDK